MSMTKIHNSDASNRKKIKNSSDNDGVLWSDIAHDVLDLVMMQLGLFDFLAFSGVCKSWRSFALSNWNRFMASIPPMPIHTSLFRYQRTVHLQDFEGRRFKSILPRIGDRKCVGVTCGGYMIFFRRKKRQFLLVNPITRHQLHFPAFPKDVPFDVAKPARDLGIRAILVFSPSASAWLFAITEKLEDKVWFSYADKGVWSRVSTTSHIHDLQVFKGKIYTLNSTSRLMSGRTEFLCEIRLGSEPKFVLLETKGFPWSEIFLEFVRSEENLYVKASLIQDLVRVYHLDFGEMKWVFHEKTMKEHAFYSTYRSQNTAVKRESLRAGTVSGSHGFLCSGING